MSLGDFYRNKRVLVTGHTGFKGAWLSIWLHHMGAHVVGLALPPHTSRDGYVLSGIGNRIEADLRGDIRNQEQVHQVFTTYQPDIVFHLAAQPLVRFSYKEPVATFDTNVMGTIHVMEAMRTCPATRVGVMITTDKCYENREQAEGYRESDALGGYDPYSASKGAAEIAISSWRRSFMHPDQYAHHGKSLASVRAGNVIGGGDWADDRIIPDCIRALEEGAPIAIRSPRAVRPWQHVLEPLSGYLLLAQRMWEEPTRFCEAWNFGPEAESVANVWTVAEKMIHYYGSGQLQDASRPDDLHEALLLTLNIDKAKRQLGWHPRTTLDDALRLTAEWYRRYKQEDVYSLCLQQIHQFNALEP